MHDSFETYMAGNLVNPCLATEQEMDPLMRTAVALILFGVALAPAVAEDVKIVRPVILSPAQGATVASPVTVTFKHVESRSSGMADITHSTHLHLIVDGPLPRAGSMIPIDTHHIHLMHGETSTVLALPPGRHTIQLIEGNGGHVVPADAPHSGQVTFQVK
jgi:hypothetical protein